jgi:phenol 2-monooxygenase
LPADGRWRVVIFAGDIRDEAAAQRLNQLADYLTSVKGPVRKFTLSGQDIDSFIEAIVVLSGERIKIEQEQIPDYFWPVTGKWKIRGKSPDTCMAMLTVVRSAQGFRR